MILNPSELVLNLLQEFGLRAIPNKERKRDSR
jgi:hypothetical protein